MKACIYAAVVLLLIAQVAHSNPPPKYGDLAAQLATGSLQAGQPVAIGGGGYSREKGNWNAGGLVGVGSKVWESRNGRHSVGVGGVYSQAAGRQNGYNWKTKPNVGVGFGYQYKFGRK